MFAQISEMPAIWISGTLMDHLLVGGLLVTNGNNCVYSLNGRKGSPLLLLLSNGSLPFTSHVYMFGGYMLYLQCPFSVFVQWKWICRVVVGNRGGNFRISYIISIWFSGKCKMNNYLLVGCIQGFLIISQSLA